MISNGQRLTTLDITDIGTLINDGTAYTAFLDISQFAGLDDVEFWFIVGTDGSFADGFGAFFDNVEVVVRDLPYFVSDFSGTVAAGASQTVDITIRTELLPPGDFILGTQVFSDAINSYYFGVPIHETYFQSRFANVSIDPEYQNMGDVSKDEPFSFDFSATNTGALDVDYFADVFLSFNNNNVNNFNDGFSDAKGKAVERFESADKEEVILIHWITKTSLSVLWKITKYSHLQRAKQCQIFLRDSSLQIWNLKISLRKILKVAKSRKVGKLKTQVLDWVMFGMLKA